MSHSPFLTALARDHKSAVVFASADAVLLVVFIVVSVRGMARGAFEDLGDFVVDGVRICSGVCCELICLALLGAPRGGLLRFLYRCSLGRIHASSFGSRLTSASSSTRGGRSCSRVGGCAVGRVEGRDSLHWHVGCLGTGVGSRHGHDRSSSSQGAQPRMPVMLNGTGTRASTPFLICASSTRRKERMCQDSLAM